MASTQITQSPSCIEIDEDDDPETILETLRDDDGICKWCFARRRRFYPSDQRADLPERDVDPSATHEVVPPRTDDRGQIVDLARPQAVCECCEVDVDPTADRSADELQQAIENIGDRLAEHDLTFTARPGRMLVAKLRDQGELGGYDDRILESAITLGRRWDEYRE